MVWNIQMPVKYSLIKKDKRSSVIGLPHKMLFMFKNYLKLAWRNICKHPLFSFINIVGLGLAIPFALLSLMQVINVFEYDNFHPEGERIYRIITNVKDVKGDIENYASSPYLLNEKLVNNYSCLEKSTKVVRLYGWELNNNIKTLNVNGFYADPSFFDMFGFSLEKGTLPLQPNTLVLTHEMAERFFGTANPIGKTLMHTDIGMLTVSGVLKHFKNATQFKSDVMVSMATLVNLNKAKGVTKSWSDMDAFTFVLLQHNATAQSLDIAINDLSKKSSLQLAATKQTYQFRRQSLKDISPDFEGLQKNAYVVSIGDLLVNLGLSLGIILLAAFNYTNLTLARSIGRAKEVGIRKAVGAKRFQLAFQFVTEAMLIAIFALLVGVFVLFLMKQNIHVGWITWEVESKTIVWMVFIGFALLTGFLSGLLPALMLSRFQPVQVLKGTIAPASLGKINFRKSLVVIQFVVTASFIFINAHMYNQFKYMATDNENYNRKNIFNITLAGADYKLLLQEITLNKDVVSAGLASSPFGGTPPQAAIKQNKMDDYTTAYYYAADSTFISNMNLTFVAGKNLPVALNDSAGNFILVNEKAIHMLRLGSAAEAVGKIILLNENHAVTIAGVVKDFCFTNYQFQLQPVVFQYNPSQFHVLSVKTNSNIDAADFTAQIKTIWKKFYPYEDMGYSWYEKEMYDRYFSGDEMKFSAMVSLVIFVIAILGLLGMVTYTTQKRIKEIGIRKVMGASALKITQTLSWSFIKLMSIAGLIALPIGYLAGLFFTNFFAFNNGINMYLIGFLFCCIFLVALITIATISIKSALVNPVKSLRSE